MAIGIGIAIVVFDEDRDRDCDINFGDRAHALIMRNKDWEIYSCLEMALLNLLVF